MPGECHLQAGNEPSLGASIGLLCFVFLALLAVVVNVSVPDVQLGLTDLLFDL